MDIFSKEKRSAIMRSVKGTNTTPELLVRKNLFKLGFRYSLHNKSLPGRPDIVLKKYKTVIFVNGCFWHGHNDCLKALLPKTQTQFWKDKIEKNKSRDQINLTKLHEMGWSIIVVFQCELKRKYIDETLFRIVESLKSGIKIAQSSP